MSKDKKDKKVKKAGTAVAASGAKMRPSRLNKISAKMERATSVGDHTGIVHTVRVIASNSPVELPGTILDMSEAGITMQHFRHGSSKELVSIIPTASVISVVGGKGEPSIVTYLGDATIQLIKQAKVKLLTAGGTPAYQIRDLSTDDTITVFVRPNIRVEISGDAASAGGAKKEKKTVKKFKK